MDRSRWQRETPASGRDERLKLHLAEIALGAAITCTQDPLMQCDLSSLPSGAGVFLYVLPLKKCSQGELIYNVVLASGVEHSESVIHIHTKRSEVKVPQSCPTLCNSMDYTVHGILQVRMLEWVAFPLLQGTFPTQGLNPGLLHRRQILYHMSYQGSSHIYMPTLF